MERVDQWTILTCLIVQYSSISKGANCRPLLLIAPTKFLSSSNIKHIYGITQKMFYAVLFKRHRFGPWDMDPRINFVSISPKNQTIICFRISEFQILITLFLVCPFIPPSILPQFKSNSLSLSVTLQNFEHILVGLNL